MSKQLRVLVVDDEDAIRNLLVRIISKDYETQAAADGETAVSLAKESKFDVAFVDMKMPGIDGLDTMRELRNMHPSIAIVIITGYAENERIQQALKEGAIACLKKPFHLNEIRALIQKEAGEIKQDGVMNILAVDDDMMFRKLFDQLNDLEQYSVVTVGDAEHAREEVTAKEFDVIFIDIVLPDEDGFKLQEEIKKISPKTKVVFFTGIEEFFEQLNTRINEGIRYSLKKPFDVQKVREILERIEKDLGYSS